MSIDLEKKDSANQAIAYVTEGIVLGIGTGSTVDYFIELLALPRYRYLAKTLISSSKRTTERLRAYGFQVTPFPHVDQIDLYIDGADEVTDQGLMIKGGGGALTQEKILAYAARTLICIVDSSKKVALLGTHPVPVEVIPMARSIVARKIIGLGGQPVYREHFITDNGNLILDCYHFKLLDPRTLETQINQIPGVVENGIFAVRRADHILIGSS